MKYIKFFKEVTMQDLPIVGGKNASLGQMISNLSELGIKVPDGFAITAQAYWYFLEQNGFLEKIKSIIFSLKDYENSQELKKASVFIRDLIESGKVPEDLEQEILLAYSKLCKDFCSVAVRSSATAEDLPGASFAGQQETFLNVEGQDNLIEAFKKCMSSLFTERAIIYRKEKGFDHFKVGLSVGVQKMVRSDLACAGVIFTLDTESGFDGVVTINSSYGLGEIVVQGSVIPDEFIVHKKKLEQGFAPIIKKGFGSKLQKIVYIKDFIEGSDQKNKNKKNKNAGNIGIGNSDIDNLGIGNLGIGNFDTEFTKKIETSNLERESFTLSDNEILELARYAILIEKYYSELNNKNMPMDIEWAKDGKDGKLYILQARPETVHSSKMGAFFESYALKESEKEIEKKLLLTGQSIGNKIVSGVVRVIDSASQISQVKAGDILVTKMTDPDWVPAMKKARAIITDSGGRTCHAAIVSRELGVAAIVGTGNGTKVLHTGQEVTVDCSQGQDGYVYSGLLDFLVEKIEYKSDFEINGSQELDKFNNNLKKCELMINIANPDSAFKYAFLPVDGVGLARVEFIISNTIKIHPMALINPDKVPDKERDKLEIENLIKGYNGSDKGQEFFVDNLAYGVGTIAAAFYPKPVIVRFSDFKSNEYRNLIGGKYFEPIEENPMIGWRGASRYYDQEYSKAFALECKAIKKCREIMGFENIKVMIPFVRTLQEAKLVLQELEKNGLKKSRLSGSGLNELKDGSGLSELGLGKSGLGQSGLNGQELEVIMMCEIPSNVILIKEFSEFFDGFSIGSNDLTQLTLGVDRDSGILKNLFDERDLAVKKMMSLAIDGAKLAGKHIGICGQAPSDLPEVAKFLIESGINYISINPDSVGQFLNKIKNI